MESTAASIAATSAPACGPYINAAVKLKMSETEKLIGTPGMRSITCALPMLSSTSKVNPRSGGLMTRARIDASSRQIPAAMTHRT